MTREEQINKAVEEIFNNADIPLEDRDNLRMWYKMGAKFADETMIEKACAYLKEELINSRDNFGYAVVASFDTTDLDGFIEDFKKTMKGE